MVFTVRQGKEGDRRNFRHTRTLRTETLSQLEAKSKYVRRKPTAIDERKKMAGSHAGRHALKMAPVEFDLEELQFRTHPKPLPSAPSEQLMVSIVSRGLWSP